MASKSLALLAAACAATVAAPAHAQELRSPTTTFFMEIALDARAPGEQVPNFGLQISGGPRYPSLRVDRQMFRLLPALAGIEATWLVAGAVGVVAVAAISSKDSSTTQALEADKQAQREACPQTC